jgi:hypothetical protein
MNTLARLLVWYVLACLSITNRDRLVEGYIEQVKHVKVFHYILPHWGESWHGIVPNCPPVNTQASVMADNATEADDFTCEWTFADHIKHLKYNLVHSVHDEDLYNKQSHKSVTVCIYLSS